MKRHVRTGTDAALTAACLLGSGLLLPACAGGDRPADVGALESDGPALVLLLSIDQLRADRLDARQPGGLGRLVREGRVFADASLEYARTETCPGHATMLTGRQPAGTGISGNTFVDRERMQVVYCVGDSTAAGTILGRGDPRPLDGRSPVHLRATTLGDWLIEARPNTRVYAVSGKDRAAITLGGKRATAAYWLDRQGSGGITTSRYYLERLPAWMKNWGVAGLLAPVPERWEHASGDPRNGARADAYVGEVTLFSMTSPHSVKPEGDTKGSLSAFVASPFLDQRTLDFARDLVVEERLGEGGGVDLLAIGLSGTDYIGHLYGPFSQEARDALIRLDHDLGVFLDFLDQRFGSGRVLVVLSADHGVLPLPEWLAEQGNGCSAGRGRIDPAVLDVGLAAHLDEVFGSVAADEAEGFVLRDGFEIFFRPERVARSGVTLARVVEVADEWLEQQPGVARAWRGSDIDAGRGPEPMLSLQRNSRVPGAGPDLVVEPAYRCLFSPWPAGTSHGSPFDYDRDVPLIFMGPGIEPGVASGRAAPVDIAPTLARELGLAVPPGLDGQVLPLRDDDDRAPVLP